MAATGQGLSRRPCVRYTGRGPQLSGQEKKDVEKDEADYADYNHDGEEGEVFAQLPSLFPALDFIFPALGVIFPALGVIARLSVAAPSVSKAATAWSYWAGTHVSPSLVASAFPRVL
jgi:hypothetical protein